MDLNRRRQVKKDEEEFCPRFQEVKKNLGERGKGDKNKFSHNIHQVNYDR